MKKYTLSQILFAGLFTFMMLGLIMVVKVSGSSVSELESEKKENESEIIYIQPRHFHVV